MKKLFIHLIIGGIGGVDIGVIPCQNKEKKGQRQKITFF